MKTSDKESFIFAGIAGIGKTTLAKKYSNVIDLESSPFAYDYSHIENPNNEQLKGDNSREPNPNFPMNYINAIKENIDKFDYIFIWAHPDKIFHEYAKHGIEYIIIRPTPCMEIQKEYEQRFLSRGNSPEWAERVAKTLNNLEWTTKLEKTGKQIIALSPGATLEDYLVSQTNLPKLVSRF